MVFRCGLSPKHKSLTKEIVVTGFGVACLSGILSAMEAANQDSIIKINFALPFRVSRLGWLTQFMDKSSSYSSETSFDSGMSDAGNTGNAGVRPGTGSGGGSSISTFMALTDQHVLLWDTAPWTLRDWSNPRYTRTALRGVGKTILDD